MLYREETAVIQQEENTLIEQKAMVMPCPFHGPSNVELQYDGDKREGRCFLAEQNKGAIFTASALRKAGCPRPDHGLLLEGPNFCKFRTGYWVRF